MTRTVTQVRTSADAVIGAVVVARMKSSRLPGKSMADIVGRPALEWILRRLGTSRHIQKMIVATTTDPADDPIAALAARLGHACFRGSEEDVLGRVHGAVQAAGLDIVVHITGDCPMVDARLVDVCVDRYLSEPVDYASLDLEAHPDGLDVEVFGADVLATVESSFSDPWIREHVTLPLYTLPDRFRATKVPAPRELHRPDYRICVDTAEDLALANAVFTHLLEVDDNFSATDIVSLLDARPDLVALNAGIKATRYACAVIGLGAVGTLYELEPFAKESVQTHARAYVKYGRTHLVAGCDVNPTRRDEFAAHWNIDRVYASADELFAREDIAIISIATPAETHASLCLQAVEAGVRGILCEKPFVLDPEQGRRVLDACEANGVRLAVNHQRRWSTRYQAMRDFIGTGQLGTIECVRAHYTKGAMNNGTHMVDLLRFLFGEVASVRATESTASYPGDDDIGGVCRMAAGFPVHLTVSDYRAHFDFEVDVIGTTGRLRTTDDDVAYWRAEPSRAEGGVKTLRPAPAPFDNDMGAPFLAVMNEFVRFLDAGCEANACTGADGLRAVEVIRSLQRSWAAGGTWVDIPREYV